MFTSIKVRKHKYILISDKYSFMKKLGTTQILIFITVSAVKLNCIFYQGYYIGYNRISIISKSTLITKLLLTNCFETKSIIEQ